MLNPIHIITPEYPPAIGGVADYTQLLVRGLADLNKEVHVWCPGNEDEQQVSGSVHVHRVCGRFDISGLRRLSSALDARHSPARLLVQWVPHGYLMKSVNVLFTTWIWLRAHVSGDAVELVMHEPGLPFRRGALRQNVAAILHRLMAAQLVSAATRIWITTPGWKEFILRWGFGRRLKINWVPVPSNIPPVNDPQQVLRIREICGSTRYLIGSFGTLGEPVAGMLRTAIAAILKSHPEVSAILIGSGSETLRGDIATANPALASRIHATGSVSAADVSLHLQACDLLVQPYPDGVNTRRGSAMAVLQHGKPLVTTIGRATESVWTENQSIAGFVENECDQIAPLVYSLLQSPKVRSEIARNGHELYTSTFDISRTLTALLDTSEQKASVYAS